jgi:type 1 glutamine amidotransferase
MNGVSQLDPIGRAFFFYYCLGSVESQLNIPVITIAVRRIMMWRAKRTETVSRLDNRLGVGKQKNRHQNDSK